MGAAAYVETSALRLDGLTHLFERAIRTVVSSQRAAPKKCKGALPACGALVLSNNQVGDAAKELIESVCKARNIYPAV